jgi:Undecaprenyl-phosphate glucose phosphotransferase
MLRKYAWVWRSLFILIELTVSAGVFLLAYQLRFTLLAGWFPRHPDPVSFEAYLQAVPAIYVILFFTNSYFRLYHPRRVSGFGREFADLLKSNLLALLLFMTFFFLNRSFSYSRSIVAIFAVLNPAAAFLLRVGVRSGLRRLRARGYNLRHVLIVGTGRPAQALLHRFRRNPWTGIRVVGLISLSPARVGSQIHGTEVVGTTTGIAEVLDRTRVGQVYIALPLNERDVIEKLIHELAERFIAIRMVPDLGFLLNHRTVTEFDGLRIVNLWENHLNGWNAFSKRALDLAVAAGALAVLSPIFLTIAALIKATTRGPVFFIQERMGHDGRLFPMVKFRTMAAGAEDDTRFTQPGDRRCTAVGRVLRQTSLDELPQLLNILAGHMSLVGPRPERPVFIEKFRETFPGYMLRHKLKAGMTGWAQVNGWRGDTSLKKRLQYDLYYLHNWSLGFDLKILWITLLRGWTHRNAY